MIFIKIQTIFLLIMESSNGPFQALPAKNEALHFQVIARSTAQKQYHKQLIMLFFCLILQHTNLI
jgi:hypothetical protein